MPLPHPLTRAIALRHKRSGQLTCHGLVWPGLGELLTPSRRDDRRSRRGPGRCICGRRDARQRQACTPAHPGDDVRRAQRLRVRRRCRSCESFWRLRPSPGRSPQPRCRPWPASGRSSARSCRADRMAISSSTFDAIAVASSRCNPMWPTRAAGNSSRTASSIPNPARGRERRRHPLERACQSQDRAASSRTRSRTGRLGTLQPPAAR